MKHPMSEALKNRRNQGFKIEIEVRPQDDKLEDHSGLAPEVKDREEEIEEGEQPEVDPQLYMDNAEDFKKHFRDKRK